MAPDLTETTPSKKEPARKPDVGRWFSTAVLFLAEIILPVILAVVLLYFLASAINFWSLQPALAQILFAVAVVAISLGLCVGLDTFLSARAPKAKGAARLRQFQLRLARLALGGLIIPLAVVLLANFIPVSGKDTTMALFIRLMTRPAQANPTALISGAVLRSSNPTTRVQGIQALQSIHTLAAQDELLRILKQDPNALKDGSEYAALAKALASYGVDAKARLLEIFNQADPAATKSAAGPAGDLYARYMTLPLEALRGEVKARAGGDAELAQVDAAAAILKNALNELQASGEHNGASLQEFVISTFLAMDLKGDSDLISFARTAAANPAFSDRLRGQALLLLAAQGGKDELSSIYPYLQDSSEVLQGFALQAIASLEVKPAQ